ncbi:MAG: hypothetical protein M1820_006939 [Bogoriella megaspora]|nr:MAG: hypothetical protein M1820_006939 [Bogoriella megaspora]
MFGLRRTLLTPSSCILPARPRVLQIPQNFQLLTSSRPDLQTSSRLQSYHTYLRESLRPRVRQQWRKKQGQYQHNQRRYQGFYRRPDPYTRFKQSQQLFQQWAARPTFYYEVAGIGGVVGGFYMWNLEEVPISGRRRFNVVSPSYERAMSDEMYRETMREYRGKILPDYDPRVMKVRQVLERLLPVVGSMDTNWEVNVIDSPERNAFVIPGGKVFVFTGILPLCRTPSRLATVLSHELAHTFAHHHAEHLSSHFFLTIPLTILARIYDLPDIFSSFLLNIAFTSPNSRAQEREADYIGMMFMAAACFEPEEAVELWMEMEKMEKSGKGGQIPRFLSTHPTSGDRVKKCREWVPEARAERDKGDCGGMMGEHVRDFRGACEGF